jgi:hypothetical protein
VASAGNLVTILVAALVILIVLALIGFGLWLFYQVRVRPTLTRAGLFPGNARKLFGQRGQASQAGQDPLGLLTQMMALQMYQQMQREARQPRQEPPAQLEDDDDSQWLLPL